MSKDLKVINLLTPERHQIILQLLKEKEVIKIQEVVELTNTSESTIRRDLSQLEAQKFLKRIHGGAFRVQGKLQEASMIEKSSKNLQGKRSIIAFAKNGDINQATIITNDIDEETKKQYLSKTTIKVVTA
jgi:DeoR/GlpR family transcriptional regulator of sugar metabolism